MVRRAYLFEGLFVQRLDKQTVVELPKAYSRESIPARRNQIPTAEIASKWRHLTRINDEIPPKQHDVEVGLLIGCNCPKALKPQEVVLGNDNDPYAVKTKLGWGIIGPVSPSSPDNEDDASFCHRIVTCEVGNTRRDGIFVVDSQTTEVINPFEVRKMFEIDFSEQHHYVKEFSQEDRKFLKIVHCGVSLQDGHYEILLPMKDRNLLLPNNYAIAWNRLKPLKERLESSETYRQHYMEFMNKVMDSGYAEKVPEEEVTATDRKPIWYIPHHGVYHPKKPNKIRVVF